jgi:hypothetical protein
VIGAPKEVKGQMPKDMLGALRKHVEDLRTSNPADVKDLGEKQIEGHTVHGYSKHSEGTDLAIWADTQTGLPVQVEMGYGGDTTRYNVTMAHFEFGGPLDPALFSTDIPKDYTVQERTVDASPSTEADLLAGLKQWADMQDGIFPDRIDMEHLMAAMQSWMKQLAATASATKTGDIITNLMPKQADYDTLAKVQRAVTFVMQLSGEKIDWTYAGRGVKLGSADEPIFWYRPKDAEKYRVVYGDLAVKDEPASALRTVPDAQRPESASTAAPPKPVAPAAPPKNPPAKK